MQRNLTQKACPQHPTPVSACTVTVEVKKKKLNTLKKLTGCLAANASSTLLRPILTIFLAVERLKVKALTAFAHAERVCT